MTLGREVRAYIALIAITLAIFVFEKIGVSITGSHALDADAWHVLGHSVPFAIGLWAFLIRQSQKNPTTMERLTSVCNIMFLAWVAYWAGTKGIERLFNPVHIPAGALLFFAIVGLFGNVLQLYFVHHTKHAHEEAHTYWGQVWHIVADLLTSVAVVGAGILILWKGWILADAIASFIVAFMVGILVLLQTKNLYGSLTHSKPSRF
ncbi:MAG TPA: cation diffusion facilitator family transporter [Candidatus Paceibacterota bacterium]